MRRPGQSYVPLVLAAAFFYEGVALGDPEKAPNEFQRKALLPLAGSEVVQKELGLSPEKTDEVRQIYGVFSLESSAAIREAGATLSFRPKPGQTQEDWEKETRAAGEKSRKIFFEQSAKHLPKLKQALGAEQFNRLRQIAWQVYGSHALTDPDVVKALGLSKEQQERIAKIHEEAVERLKTATAPSDKPGFKDVDKAKSREVTKERDDRCIELLTNDQRATYGKMLGKPFDVESLDQPRRRDARPPRAQPRTRVPAPEKE